jgi:LemA protein
MKYFGLIVLGAVAIVAATLWTGYNGLVSRDEAVNAAWSEVQNQLKRRTDLIGNLVETVKGSAAHEHTTLADLVKERAKVSQAVNVDVSKLVNDPEAQKKLLEAQNSMNASLTRFLAVAESYPQLKANESFLKLQDELAGTENRVAVARGRAIATTQEYNKGIRTFPAVFIARFAGFTAKEYYKAPEEEQKAPQVHF